MVWFERERERERAVAECDTNFPTLNHLNKKDIINDICGSNNIFIEGDNYHALMCLNYTHREKIGIIYIDPPYNTGNNDFKFNDVWVQKEDCFRHSKWLNFMEKRLRLSKNLLTDDGVCFISIDDNEFANLKLLCDEIFNENNYIGFFKWYKSSDEQRKNTKKLDIKYEYILCYQKSNKFKGLRTNKIIPGMSNPDNDKRGKWFNANISSPVTNPNSKNVYEASIKGFKITRRWFIDKGELQILIDNDKIYLPIKNGVPGVPRQKKFIEDFESEKNVTIDEIYDDDMTTTIGRERLEFLLEKENPFPYPKPPKLIYFLISCVQTKKITVLDFFAGSGTTADAISMFEDKNINFILCTNNENNICDEITYPRISKIINKNNVAYFKTSLVPHKQKICDTDRSTFTKAVGELIGLKENTIETVKLNSYYHILNNRKRSKCTLIYFNEDLYKWDEALDAINADCKIYKFSYDPIEKISIIRNDHKITVEDIPEPILRMYESLQGEENV